MIGCGGEPDTSSLRAMIIDYTTTLTIEGARTALAKFARDAVASGRKLRALAAYIDASEPRRFRVVLAPREYFLQLEHDPDRPSPREAWLRGRGRRGQLRVCAFTRRGWKVSAIRLSAPVFGRMRSGRYEDALGRSRRVAPLAEPIEDSRFRVRKRRR